MEKNNASSFGSMESDREAPTPPPPRGASSADPNEETSTFAADEASHRPERQISSSVQHALRDMPARFSGSQLIAALLQLHPEYGGEHGREMYGRFLAQAKEQSEPLADAENYLRRLDELLEPGIALTGRRVIVGLMLLGPMLHPVAGGIEFLASIARENSTSGRVEEVLTPQARGLLQEILGGSGGTPTLSDSPIEDENSDDLGRAAFADVLAARIRRLRATEQHSPLVVHLDGAWGSGKSSVLNLLAAQLKSPERGRPGWIIVRYNAWQQQRIETPWWTLVTLIVAEASRQFRQENRQDLSRSLERRQFWFRTFAGREAILFGGGAAILAGVLMIALGHAGSDKSAVVSIKDMLGVAVAVFGAVVAASKFLTAADTNAEAFLRSRPDPVGALVRYLDCTLATIRRPVAILIDDIDRCEAAAVVRVLEGVQTIFATLPLVTVVAGDGKWIASAFEKVHGDAVPRDAGKTSARPLGGLFLEKIFQFSAIVPEIAIAQQERLWVKLLGLPTEPIPGATKAALDRVAVAVSEEDVLRAVDAIDPRENPVAARHVREAAMRRLVADDLIEKPSFHVLQMFARFVEPNPRSMKRQIMAYGMARAYDLASFRNTPQRTLAAWSLLSMRWPLLADWIRADPARLTQSEADVGVSEEGRVFSTMLKSPAVAALTSFLISDRVEFHRMLGAKAE